MLASSIDDSISKRSHSRKPRQRPPRGGYTLIEILIGVVVTLILLGIMIRAFVYAGDAISKGRAIIELSGELRSASESLRHDLRSATVRFLPWSSVGANEGYFEMWEGPTADNSFAGAVDPDNNNAIMDTYGDADDVLMFTARNLDHPYQGLFNGAVIESKDAEIIWWAVHTDQGNPGLNANESITLRRRVLLIAPQLNDATGVLAGTNGMSPAVFLQNNDVSVHVNSNGDLVANTIADLTKRENRFAHNRSAFPYPINRLLLDSLSLVDAREGEDVVLSHVTGFDVKIFDPTAPIGGYALPNGEMVALTSDDPGFASSAPIGQGDFVNLGYGAAISVFSGAPEPRSQLGALRVYDTWSSHYENDGVNQDADALTDQGTDGLDNDGLHGPDDEAERETSPPYPHPLRGVQVTFRVRDPASQQIRQTSIESSFIPE